MKYDLGPQGLLEYSCFFDLLSVTSLCLYQALKWTWEDLHLRIGTCLFSVACLLSVTHVLDILAYPVRILFY